MQVNCTTTYILVGTSLRINPTYVLWYINVSNLILTAFMPLAMLCYFNCKIMIGVHNFKERHPSNKINTPNNKRNKSLPRSDRMKINVLFIIVILFVITHSLRLILNISETIYLARNNSIEVEGGCRGVTIWTYYANPFNAFFIIINASCNFFVYVYCYTDFNVFLRRSPIVRTLVCFLNIGSNNESNISDVISRKNTVELDDMHGNNV